MRQRTTRQNQPIQAAFKMVSRASRYPVVYLMGAMEAARLLRARLLKPRAAKPPRLF